MKTKDIHIRDPFVLPVVATQTYYLYGTTGKSTWAARGEGFDVYRSTDLATWDGPRPAFRPDADFWATMNFWAPEVHAYHDRFYMFATFKAPQRYRGTQILIADAPEGPFTPLTGDPITPPDWERLDGTLHIDRDGAPWIVFCHEWVQIHNGAMVAQRLSDDLTHAVDRPILLFNASEAPWVRPIRGWPDAPDTPHRFPCYITDGPFLHRLPGGDLLMLWSSFGEHGYTLAVARSETGHVTGPWAQDPTPLWTKDGGHGMLFHTFDGKLYVTFHSPNQSPHERPVFLEVEETADTLRIKEPNVQ